MGMPPAERFALGHTGPFSGDAIVIVDLDNSVLTRLRAMYGTRNLEWRAAAFLIVSRPGRQAMVDLGLVPECPHNSMTSAAAMHGLVAGRPCKRPGTTPLESLSVFASRAEPGSNCR